METIYNFFKPMVVWLLRAVDSIDGAAFMGSLPIMGKGMLGIFIATGIMVLVMFLLSQLTKKRP